MLSSRERLAVVNLYEELGSYRAVAALVGCDHKTVKAWLERERDGRSVTPRPRATDRYLPLIRAKVEATHGKVKSKPLLRVLRAAGYTASLRVLQRTLKDVRQEWSHEHRRVYRPWVSAPGEFLIVDWGDVGTIRTAAGERKLLCFCAVLGWSRWKYVRFFTAQRTPCSPRAWPAASRRWAASPPTCCSITRRRSRSASWPAPGAQPAAGALGQSHRFNPATAAPNDAETKGKVEALVKFVKAQPATRRLQLAR